MNKIIKSNGTFIFLEQDFTNIIIGNYFYMEMIYGRIIIERCVIWISKRVGEE